MNNNNNDNNSRTTTMDPIKKIETLEIKREKLEHALAVPGISEAERIAISNRIVAYTQEITALYGMLPRLTTLPQSPPGASAASQTDSDVVSRASINSGQPWAEQVWMFELANPRLPQAGGGEQYLRKSIEAAIQDWVSTYFARVETSWEPVLPATPASLKVTVRFNDSDAARSHLANIMRLHAPPAQLVSTEVAARVATALRRSIVHLAKNDTIVAWMNGVDSNAAV